MRFSEMGGVSNRRLALAVVVLLAAALLVRSSCTIRGQEVAVVLHEGTLSAPLAGIWLADEPRLFVHDLAGGLGERPGLEPLSSNQRFTFSEDRRETVVATWAEERWSYRISGGPRFFLEGEPTFVPAARARGTLAIVPAGNEGESRLLWLGPAGDVLAGFVASDVRWASASPGGGTVLGTAEGVALVNDERTGAVRVFPGVTRRGVLSAKGRWLAFEHAYLDQARVELWAPGDPGAPHDSATVAPGRVLRIDPAERWVVHVSDGEVLLFTAGLPLAPLFRRPAPAGWEWRDGTFDGSGRLALGRIRVVARPRRDPNDAANPFRPGEARVAVELLAPETSQPERTVEWSVPLWNHASPELAFGADGRLYAAVWPSAFEVSP